MVVSTPGKELVDGYLKEIARTYKIKLDEEEESQERLESQELGDGEAEKGKEISGDSEDAKDEVDELTRRFEALKKQR